MDIIFCYTYTNDFKYPSFYYLHKLYKMMLNILENSFYTLLYMSASNVFSQQISLKTVQ